MAQNLEWTCVHLEQLLEGRHGTISDGTTKLKQLNHVIGVPFVKKKKKVEKYCSEVGMPARHVEELF